MIPAPAISKQTGQRVLRIVHIAFIAAMLLQLYVLLLVKKGDHPVDRALMIGITAMALVMATVGLVMRFFVLPKVDAQAAAIDTWLQRRWTLYIVAFAVSETIWLFGFVLSFLGAPLMAAFTFLAIALTLMLLCTPRQV
jgi:hypothetical protein